MDTLGLMVAHGISAVTPAMDFIQTQAFMFKVQYGHQFFMMQTIVDITATPLVGLI